MSLSKRIFIGASLTWISRMLTVGLNLLLLPILFRYLGKEELGLWFLLGQSGAFIGLMDLGLTHTLTRRVALARGKSGSDPSAALTRETKEEIAALIVTARTLYRYLAIGAFIVVWVVGAFFITNLAISTLSERTIWIAWTIMCLSHALGVWASVWNCVLQGVGHVGRDVVISTSIAVIILLGQIVGSLAGGGLVTLALFSALGAYMTRYLTMRLVKAKEPGLFDIQGKWSIAVVRDMMRPSIFAWLTGLGGFLILKTDQYFIAYYIGTSHIPSYQAAYNIVFNLFILSISLASASGVFISHLWQQGKVAEVHKVLIRNLRIGMATMLCGTIFMTIAGRQLIGLWIGQDNFIGYPTLAIFCITLCLEAHHVIFAYASRATEDEVYAPWALAAGILNLAFTWMLIRPFGIVGVALGTCFAQLITNNWFAVYRGFVRLQLEFRAYVRQVLVPLFLFLLPTIAVTMLIGRAGESLFHGIGKVAGAALASGTCLAVFILISVQGWQPTKPRQIAGNIISAPHA